MNTNLFYGRSRLAAKAKSQVKLNINHSSLAVTVNHVHANRMQTA